MVHTFAGSQEVFIAAEALCEAFQQSAALVTQCCDTGDAGIWAMEDSIEFQSVGLELLNAVTGNYFHRFSLLSRWDWV